MFEEVLSRKAQESLALLGRMSFFQKAYLAGGTALALHLGHRQSRDFDFFTRKEFMARSLAEKLKRQLPNFKLGRIAWGTIVGLVSQSKFSLFYYEYPLLFEPHRFLGVKVADPRDIAAMKIASIADRGKKRDFLDLYFLLQDKIVTLQDCLDFYDRKFKKLRQNKLHILKSLAYFADAETEKMPKMFRVVSWREVKRFLGQESSILAKKYL